MRVNVTQGSSLLATLGFAAESLWDSSAQADFKLCNPPGAFILRG